MSVLQARVGSGAGTLASLFAAGSGVTISGAGTPDNPFVISASGSSSAAPGGVSGDVQYNASGVMAGSSRVTVTPSGISINGGSGFGGAYALDIHQSTDYSALGLAINGQICLGNGGFTDPVPGVVADLKMGGPTSLSIAIGGGLKIGHMADSQAPNDCDYFSTTANKRAYKDSSGTVNYLY